MIFTNYEGVTPKNLKLIRDDTGEYRHYIDENGERYLSVTSFLSQVTDTKVEIEKWKAAVGVVESERIMNNAATKGTAIHLACEKLLANDPNPDSHLSIFDKFDFKPLRKYLEENITEIFASEHQMYSRKLKLAGTCDLIAKHKGKLAIIDFKTSSSIKYKDMITSYFLQAACYAVFLYEHYTIIPEELTIIMSVDKDPNVYVFVEPVNKWVKEVLALVNNKKKETTDA